MTSDLQSSLPLTVVPSSHWAQAETATRRLSVEVPIWKKLDKPVTIPKKKKVRSRTRKRKDYKNRERSVESSHT